MSDQIDPTDDTRFRVRLWALGRQGHDRGAPGFARTPTLTDP
jgi:hypothetical protein